MLIQLLYDLLGKVCVILSEMSVDYGHCVRTLNFFQGLSLLDFAKSVEDDRLAML